MTECTDVICGDDMTDLIILENHSNLYCVVFLRLHQERVNKTNKIRKLKIY